MSETAGLAMIIIGVALIFLSFGIMNFSVMEERLVLDQTFSVSGRSWKSIGFYSEFYSGGKLKGQITSNRPINAYINYSGNEIKIYDWGAEGITQANFEISLGKASNTLDIYNPSLFFSATVHALITERITSHPYSSLGAGLFYLSFFVLLPVGVVLIALSRRKGKTLREDETMGAEGA